MTLVYHYTSATQHLPLILASGELRPSSAGGKPGEPPLLWFSYEPHWEPTAGKGVMLGGKFRLLTMQQQHATHGCARFGMDSLNPWLMGWCESFRHAGISRNERRAMEKAGAKRGGHQSNWLAVPVSELVCEVFNGITWEPLQ